MSISNNQLKNFHDEVEEFMRNVPESYELPMAGASTLGGVVINGGGLSINEETGVLSIVSGVILNTIPSTVEGAMWYIP